MSLVKSPLMTDKKVAANARNRKLAHGPVTLEGRERIRAAQVRHGFYAEDVEVAMRALGEDPAHLQELTEGLWEEFNPLGSMQEGLVIRLARATWLMNRADRMQEGCAVRQANDVNTGRAERLHARMMRLKIMADSLRQLAQSVGREFYVTTPVDLDLMKNLQQEGILKDSGDIALTLFYQLQPPGIRGDGIDPDEKSRRALAKFKAIFGLDSDTPPAPRIGPDSSQPPKSSEAQFEGSGAGPRTPPIQAPVVIEVPKEKRYPRIGAAEWEKRERPRQLLENILKRQVEVCEVERKITLKESLKGPSPFERAAEIAPTHPNAKLMRRMQDSNFREVRRVANLLLKLKRSERKMGVLDQEDEECGRA